MSQFGKLSLPNTLNYNAPNTDGATERLITGTRYSLISLSVTKLH